MAFQLSAYFFFQSQIFALPLLHFIMLGTSLFKEMITGILEFFEYFFPEFLRHRSDIFPLLLKGLKFIGGAFPIVTFFQFDSFLDQVVLHLQVLLSFLVEFLKERVLVIEKCFECRPELLVHVLGLRSWQTADQLPAFLKFENILSLLIPLLYPVRLKTDKCLHFLTQ